ncbi:unnamed protein product [Taenia asiatica]|uniref:Transposase n=1 Tax=Taenia asiatica TaxID=60517 RepID=A0A0R3WEU1_TAEAS|nr:unnamed protein product [Taenia asiatica]
MPDGLVPVPPNLEGKMTKSGIMLSVAVKAIGSRFLDISSEYAQYAPFLADVCSSRGLSISAFLLDPVKVAE